MNDKKVISRKTLCVLKETVSITSQQQWAEVNPTSWRPNPPISGGQAGAKRHWASRQAHLAEGAVVSRPEALVAGLGLLPGLPQPPLQRWLLGGHVEDDRPQVGVLVGGANPVVTGVCWGAETQALENTGRIHYDGFSRVFEEHPDLK